MNMFSLNGSWKLYFYPEHTIKIEHPSQLTNGGIECINANVPGNVELDLSRSGYLPDDLFFGENIKTTASFSLYEFWYVKEFSLPSDFFADSSEITLCFNGVDCIAEYWLNGETIGHSENMFIEHIFDVTGKLCTKNTIAVRLSSPLIYASKQSYQPLLTYTWGETMVDSLYLRKAPHSFGWDIMPRALSAGIWRNVELVCHDKFEILDLYPMTERLENNTAAINLHYELKIPVEFSTKEMYLEINGECNGHSFTSQSRVFFRFGVAFITIDNPYLWWPKGYGDQNLYNISVKLKHNNTTLCKKKINFGIRKVTIEYSDTHTKFLIKVNGTPILCKGTNWVPTDVFHSRDRERVLKILGLVNDLGCNIIRCWGGNVYEDHDFFDYCDKNGIMVWQDFAFACASYPQDSTFLENVKNEAKSIVKKLRSHTSLILWSGDNECDSLMAARGINPKTNKITRDILPSIVFEYDPYRFFYPSSPYVSDKTYNENLPFAEDHLWGARDYYKSNYYTQSKAQFISEIGYHGCPSSKSIKKFISREYIWPDTFNSQWILHSTNHNNDPSRIKLMYDQVKELFGSVPDNLEDFITASQISQAEALKFFIEMVRLGKWDKTGIIWWNVIDGWPQFSDSIVDYYFEKKLAYHYIKRVQTPTCIIIHELSEWKQKVYITNDSNSDVYGSYVIKDADTNEIALFGDFYSKANENMYLGEISASHSEHRLFLIESKINENIYRNHYITGFPPFSFEQYKKWLKILGA